MKLLIPEHLGDFMLYKWAGFSEIPYFLLGDLLARCKFISEMN